MRRLINSMSSLLLPIVALTAAPGAASGQERLLGAIGEGESRPLRSVVQELGTSLTRTETRVNKAQTRGYRKHFLENGDMLLEQVRKTTEGSTVVTRTHIQRQPDGKHSARHLFTSVLNGRGLTSYANGTMYHRNSGGFGGFIGKVQIDHLTSPGSANSSIRKLDRQMQSADRRMDGSSAPWKPFGRLAKSVSSWNARHKIPRPLRKAHGRATQRLIGRR